MWPDLANMPGVDAAPTPQAPNEEEEDATCTTWDSSGGYNEILMDSPFTLGVYCHSIPQDGIAISLCFYMFRLVTLYLPSSLAGIVTPNEAARS